MRRRKHRCPACERAFGNEQAIRAHLRWCDAYRRRRAHAAESTGMPKADVSTSVVGIEKRSDPVVISPDPTKVLKRRRGRQSQEALMLLLDVDELFPKLKDESREHADLARVFFHGLEDAWNKLCEALEDIHRDYAQLVIGMCLDPALLFSIYQRMLGIKEQWLSLRARELTPVEDDREVTQESHDALREEREWWAAIIYKLKKMLVMSC